MNRACELQRVKLVSLLNRAGKVVGTAAAYSALMPTCAAAARHAKLDPYYYAFEF